VRAVAEGAERYSSFVFVEDEFIVASANELGARVLDLRTIPRSSEAELADPRSPLRLADPAQPIRWVRGISLMTREETFIPAILTHLYVRAWPAERFWLPISTGVAAHTNPVSAMLSAVCEVIERDAIALTWLGRLPLARIDAGDLPDVARAFRDRLSRGRVQQSFYDATTDVGVPTILSVQITPDHPTCQLALSCATSMDATQAYVKAIREAAPARTVIGGAEREIPTDVADFRGLTHGADYYGRGGHFEDFDFLLNNGRRTTLGEVAARALRAPGTSEEEQLRAIVGRLAELGMDAYVVDLTADEVRDAGLWVVRVIVPQLMPISFTWRARYLGTPRLYTYTGLTEAELHPGPMPFG
jgi:ribosomal protein S12 methylthiotransferase accessory factor